MKLILATAQDGVPGDAAADGDGGEGAEEGGKVRVRSGPGARRAEEERDVALACAAALEQELATLRRDLVAAHKLLEAHSV